MTTPTKITFASILLSSALSASPALAQESLKVSTASSMPFVCSMIGLPMPKGITATQFEAYQAKLIRECEIAEEYRSQSELARQNYEMSLTDISSYQALRYIERSRYDQGREQNQPVALTYQICYSDYDRPVQEKSSIIWQNWVNGVSKVERESRALRNGAKFKLSDLLKAHAGFYELSDEFCPRTEGAKRTGHNNIPYPGRLKPSNSYEPDRYWWKFSTDEEAMKAKSATEQINAFYRELGILGQKYMEDGVGISDVLSVRRLDGQYAIWSGESQANESHLDGLFRLLNSMNAKARRGVHMVWETASGQKILMTPVELALLAQQYMVQIHPFAEGNGRVARFVQEIVLQSFDLPHGPSGDLMDDDVLMTHQEYYRLAIKRMGDLLADTDRCLVDVYPAVLGGGPGVQIRYMDQNRIPYECRILR